MAKAASQAGRQAVEGLVGMMVRTTTILPLSTDPSSLWYQLSFVICCFVRVL